MVSSVLLSPKLARVLGVSIETPFSLGDAVVAPPHDAPHDAPHTAPHH